MSAPVAAKRRAIVATLAGGLRRVARVRRVPLPANELFEAALPAARARAFTEAIVLFLAGFVLDDLRALRVPGFAVGAALAAVVLAFGSTLHARNLATDYGNVPREDAERRLARSRSLWRLASASAFALLASWLVVTSAGVDLWPA